MAACNQTEVRSQSGGPCSLSDDDNPHYACDPSVDLVCIDTTKEGKHYCRMACEVGDKSCVAGEVCCPGTIHGETDEFGFNVVRDPVHVHDLNATLLHLLGLDHERLTYRFQGRDYRLTDVHGNVVHDVLA